LITEYFQALEADVSERPYIVESALVKDQRSLYIGLIEGRITFANDSSLHFIEFVNVKTGINVYKYSYHYQDSKENLIFRYDMAPHHSDIKTYPHHKHTPGQFDY
jgi:hypothetical protein